MRPQIVSILTLVLSFLSSASMLAQTVSPPPPRQTRGPELPLPIDSDLMLLLSVGVLLGVYVVYKKIKCKLP